jgi:hypothetical protein
MSIYCKYKRNMRTTGMKWTKIYQTLVDFIAYRNYEFYDNLFRFNEYEISCIRNWDDFK